MNVSRIRSRTLTRRTAVQAGAAGLGSAIIAGRGTSALAAAQSATPAISPESEKADRVQQAVDALDSLITEMMSTSNVPGLSIAVVYQDDVLLTRGYGTGNTESDTKVDADTIFQLASLSKPIASTVVASIVGDGLVNWDTRVVEHLPGFMLHDPWITTQVTIRDMLTHRSGLPGHAGDDLEDMGYDRDEVLHRLRYQPLTSGFRAMHNYTNFGFTAGALTASNADGATWEDVSDTRLYQPAGMSRTSSRFDDFANSDNRADGHVNIDGAWTPRYVRQPDAQSPAGGVSSSATDMAQWLRLQLGNGVLNGIELVPSDALDETHRPQSFSRPPANPSVDRAGFYGLGWNVSYDDRGAVQLSHSGAFAIGTGTTVYMLPAENVGIVVLTNATPVGLAEAVALSFLDVVKTGEIQKNYLPLLGPVMEASLALDYGKDVDYSNPPTQPNPPQAISTYSGTYLNDYYGPVEITQDGDGLTLSQGPIPNIYPLPHWDRDTFLYLPIGENANALSAVSFTIGPDGTASQVQIENLNILGLGTFIREPADK